MTTLASTLRRSVAELDQLGASIALVGGLAVSVRTEPRFTRDIDLAVAVRDDAEAEQLVRSLLASGFEPGAAVEQVAAQRLATVRLCPPGTEAHVVDLLFASSGIEREVVALAEPLDVLPALTVPVARTGHLVALKLLSRDDEGRPQDAVDLHALVRRATPEDRDLAAEACSAIVARGFARDRDLVAALHEVFDR